MNEFRGRGVFVILVALQSEAIAVSSFSPGKLVSNNSKTSMNRRESWSALPRFGQGGARPGRGAHLHSSSGRALVHRALLGTSSTNYREPLPCRPITCRGRGQVQCMRGNRQRQVPGCADYGHHSLVLETNISHPMSVCLC